MTLQWEKVHVFISSTFNDMHAERDYLVKSVFPELREWCEERKLRLVDIDLRWGVTEQDATQNKNVVKVCLDRIDDCRPFFLCFLGQRRGWVPEESDISIDTRSEFPGLREYVGVESVTELEIRHALIEPLHKGVRVEKKPDDRYYQKADHAFFYLREDSYLARLPGDPPQLREIYTNESLDDEADRSLANSQLEYWREVEIREKSGRPVRDYQVTWDPEGNTPELLIPLQSPSEGEENIKRWKRQWDRVGMKVTGTEISEDRDQAKKAREYNQRLTRGRLGSFLVNDEPLSRVIIQDLKEGIAARFPDHLEIAEETDLQKEIDQQEQFLFTASQGFIKRGDDFEALDDYVQGGSNQLFVLTAPAGLGKSTLLANWIDHYRGEIAGDAQQTVHFRFIGQSDRSTNVYSLLHFLLRELKEVHGKFDAEIPDDPQDLRQSLPELLKEAGSKSKTIIVIDALNQLEVGLDDLSWLPYQLPENVKLIVSFKVGEPPADDLIERMNGSVVHAEVKSFDELDHRRQLVETYLEQFLKQLDERHLESMINLPAASNPLYLKVVLSELRVFGAFANLGEKIRSDFGSTPISAFDRVMDRLETDPAYSGLDPEIVVPLLFGLLAHARQGLSVAEFSTIFLDELGMEENEGNRKEVSDTIHHFLRQVRPFLAQRAGRHDFLFESFRIAAQERYTAKKGDPPSEKRVSREWHRLLAAYFDGLSTWIEVEDKGKPVPNSRKVSELPFHQAWGEFGERLVATLTNFEFLDAKVQAFGSYLLIEDFILALDPNKALSLAAVDNAREDLLSIQRALLLSNTVLSKFPDQIHSQLTGRLLSHDGEAVKHLLSQVHNLDRPWLRTLTQSLIQANSALVKIIPVTGYLIKAALSPDAQWIATCNEDGLVEAWDLRIGRKLCEFQIDSVIDEYNDIAISSDGQHLLVTIESEDLLELWDLNLGTQISILKAVVNGYTYRIDDETNRIQMVWPPTQVKSASNFVIAKRPGDRIINVKIEFGKTSGSPETETPDGKFALKPILESLVGILDQELGTDIPQILVSEGFNFDLVISPDGLYVAYVIKNDASEIRIYDLVGGCEHFVLMNPRHNWRLAFSPDSRQLISFGRKLCVWDMETRLSILQVDSDSRGPTKIVVSPDGSKVIAVFQNAEVHAWDLKTGVELPLVFPDKGFIGHRLTVTSDGRYLILYWDKNLLVWDLDRGLQINKFKDTIGIRALAVTPDAKRLVAGGNSKLMVWDPLKGDEIWLLDSNSKLITDVALSPDGRRAVSITSERVLDVWDLDTGERIASFSGETAFTKCGLSNDGMTVIAGEELNLLHILRLEGAPSLSSPRLSAVEPSSPETGLAQVVLTAEKTGVRLDESIKPRWLMGHQDDVTSVALTPDGRRAVSGSLDNTLRVWDLQSGKVLRTLRGHTDEVYAVAVNPDELQAVSGSRDTTLKVWDLDSGEELCTLEGHTWPVTSVVTDPYGYVAISGSEDSSLKVWALDLDNWKHLFTLVGHNLGPVNALSVSPDGSRAITSSSDDWDLRVWDLENARSSYGSITTGIQKKMEELHTLIGHTDEVNALAVIPDWRYAVSASSDKTLKIWDLERGELLGTLEGHTGHVQAVAVTPGGDYAISGSMDKTIKIWDLVSGEAVCTLEGHKHGVYAVAVTPDARFIVSGSGDNALGLWDMVSGEVKTTLEKPTGGVVDVQVDQKPEVSAVDEDNTLAQTDTFREKGEEYLKTGQLNEALNCFDQALKLQPDDLTILDLRADVLIGMGDIQEVLKFIDHLLEKDLAGDKTLGKMYKEVGFAMGAIGGVAAYEEAAEYYQMASALVSDDWEIWYYQGLANHHLGYYEEALECLQRAKEIDDNQQTNLLIDSCYEQMEEYWDEE